MERETKKENDENIWQKGTRRSWGGLEGHKLQLQNRMGRERQCFLTDMKKRCATGLSFTINHPGTFCTRRSKANRTAPTRTAGHSWNFSPCLFGAARSHPSLWSPLFTLVLRSATAARRGAGRVGCSL